MTTIREAGPADARAIAEIHVESWRDAYRDILPAELLDRLSVERREEQWRSFMPFEPPVHGFVAEEAGRTIGFAICGDSEDDPPAGELNALYVRPDALGSGAGHELLEAATAALRDEGFEEAVLWTFEANPRARRFYERAGWRADGGLKPLFDTHVSESERTYPAPQLRYRRAL